MQIHHCLFWPLHVHAHSLISRDGINHYSFSYNYTQTLHCIIFYRSQNLFTDKWYHLQNFKSLHQQVQKIVINIIILSKSCLKSKHLEHPVIILSSSLKLCLFLLFASDYWSNHLSKQLHISVREFLPKPYTKPYWRQ